MKASTPLIRKIGPRELGASESVVFCGAGVRSAPGTLVASDAGSSAGAGSPGVLPSAAGSSSVNSNGAGNKLSGPEESIGSAPGTGSSSVRPAHSDAGMGSGSKASSAEAGGSGRTGFSGKVSCEIGTNTSGRTSRQTLPPGKRRGYGGYFDGPGRQLQAGGKILCQAGHDPGGRPAGQQEPEEKKRLHGSSNRGSQESDGLPRVRVHIGGVSAGPNQADHR